MANAEEKRILGILRQVPSAGRRIGRTRWLGLQWLPRFKATSHAGLFSCPVTGPWACTFWPAAGEESRRSPATAKS